MSVANNRTISTFCSASQNRRRCTGACNLAQSRFYIVEPSYFLLPISSLLIPIAYLCTLLSCRATADLTIPRS
jgi:hypothetical protein